MSIILDGMAVLLCLAMVVAAFVAIREPEGEAHAICQRGSRGISVAILAAGLVSLIASVLFLILASPDVAMTEAAIGSGLTTFLFFFVLDRVRGDEEQGQRKPEDAHD